MQEDARVNAGAVIGRWVGAALIPLAVGVGFMVLCRQAAGESLGLFFGGVGIVAIAGPGVVLAQTRSLDRAVAFLALVGAVAGTWLAPVLSGYLTFTLWAQCSLVLATFGLAAAGLALAMQRLRLPSSAAAACAVVLALAWLSWPIWMSPWMSGTRWHATASRLVRPHPLFAINGVMLHAYPIPWMQHPLAYRLANLGDDIPYELPRTVLPAAGVHVAIALATLAVAGVGRRRAPASIQRETFT